MGNYGITGGLSLALVQYFSERNVLECSGISSKNGNHRKFKTILMDFSCSSGHKG